MKKHSTTGRPKKAVAPSTIGYHILGKIVPSSEKKLALEKTKVFLIFSTNDLNKKQFPAVEVLKTY